MVIRVIGDELNPSLANIPSDENPDVEMDVGVNGSGDFFLTLRDTKTGDRIEFGSEGVHGGSRNRHLGPVFANFARELFKRASDK